MASEGEKGGRKGPGGRGPRKPAGPRGEGGKAPFRPRGDRPAGDRPAGAKPYRARADRPQGEGGERKPFRPRGDRPQGEGGERPAGARNFRPRGDRPQGEGGDRPAGARSFRPRGDRPQGEGSDRPAGARSFRPRGDRPQGEGGDRPAGARSFRPCGDRPPFEGGERKPFRPRSDRPQGEGGERKPFRPRGDRPQGEGGERKPFRPRGDRPQSEGGERKPFRPRGDRPHGEGGERFRPRQDQGFQREERALRPHRPVDAVEEAEGGERIAKRLARAGIASRRDAEMLIAAGRVRVNGRVLASPAVNVQPSDRVELDGKLIPEAGRTRLFLFHKPAGVVTTNRDPEGRRTVFDVLPADLPRLVTIGRLDINTEGLLLLTNDGGLARVLELPQTGWLRRYRARVHGRVDETALLALKDGIAIDGVFYGAIEAELEREQGSNAWLTLGLREGKNREVKNVLGALGLQVTRLIRVSFGPFQLAELGEGEVREIRGRHLRDQLGARLIEESGANFDAPVAEASAEPAPRDEAAAPRPKRPRPDAATQRELARGKLSTRPGGFDGLKRPRGDRPFAERRRDDAPGGPPERPSEPGASRTVNVWRAPGARPGKPKGDKGAPDGNRNTEKPGGGDRPKGGRGRGDAGRRR